jgi:hypothetical protein
VSREEKDSRSFDALERKLDRYLEARVEDPRSRQLRRINNAGPGIALALGSMGLAVPINILTVIFVQGETVLGALFFEWLAIAGINVAYALSWASVRRAMLRHLDAPAGTPPAPEPVPASQPAAAIPAAAIPAAPPAPLAPPADPLLRLPLGVRAKAEQIRLKADLFSREFEQAPMGSRNLYILRRIQSEYLPATLQSYLALGGDDRALSPDGRTGQQVLRDQLELLDGKLDEIADDLQRENIDRLLTNQRFLEEHFGRGAGELDALIHRGPASPAPGSAGPGAAERM